MVHYENGDKRYILSQGIQVGDIVQSSDSAEINIGNTLPLSEIPAGSLIHNIGTPGKGGQLVRSAGAFALLMAKSGKYATVKLPSSEIRLVLPRCKQHTDDYQAKHIVIFVMVGWY